MLEPLTLSGFDQRSKLRAAILKLNNDHAVELSWADEPRMRRMIAEAFIAQRVGVADALLIAFDQDANYDSVNFQWLRSRFESFVYVDRVVTAASARNRGFARMLYADLIQRASDAGHVRVVCEINSDPPNPASESFHRKLGFQTIGSAPLENGKTVDYQELSLKSFTGQA